MLALPGWSDVRITAAHRACLARGRLMRAVVQRVTGAHVDVDGETVGEIGTGLLVLVGVTHSDTTAEAHALARKVHGLRILRAERSLADTPGAGVLVVSQFTLYGDARKGRRPSWSAAAPASQAHPLVDAVAAQLRLLGAPVATGRFGADMRVHSVNDGPVTVLLEA
jgi:D-tyrosyl-tRNA(Tyr) deacylase